jgi:hypothetical protein
MDKYGLIHDKLDLKILILYILNRLPEPASDAVLADLCQCDAGVSYFEYAESLAELVDTGHVARTEAGYSSTEKGHRNGETIESSLPYTVRAKAEKELAPVAAAMRRDAMITTEHSEAQGGFTVRLSMSDGISDVISVSLLVPDEETAKKMEKSFRANPEDYYDRITAMLCE